jgi:hypothetical protein
MGANVMQKTALKTATAIRFDSSKARVTMMLTR